VSVNGFSVKSPTWDDPWQWDGKGDEVYIRAKVVKLGSTGASLYESEYQSVTMGDTRGYSGRVKAGSLSAEGGLRMDDTFPTGTPWLQSTPPDLYRDYPPLKLWEGDLNQGEAVVLTPSIWEWDGGGSAVVDWARWAAGAVPQLAARISDFQDLGAKGRAVIAGIELGLGVILSLDEAKVSGRMGDRPIGMSKNGDGTAAFSPQMLVLTQESAELLVREQPVGKGPGVVTMEFKDDDAYRGNYTLWLQVEKVGVQNGVAVDTTARYNLVAKHSGACLDVTGGETAIANGAPIQQWQPWGGRNQAWQFQPVGDGSYHLVASHSGRCLDVAGGPTAMGNGVALQQWDDVGGDNQKWYLVPVEDGFCRIVAKHSGKCLDVRGGPTATANGAVVQQYDYLGGDNQKWRLRQVA
jgi:hypothetical protein